MEEALLSVKNVSAWYGREKPVLFAAFRADEVRFGGRAVGVRDRDFKLCRYTVFAEDNSFRHFTFREYLPYVFSAYARRLPDGERMFLAPYCLFIFLCNITAAAVFLCSFRLK